MSEFSSSWERWHIHLGANSSCRLVAAWHKSGLHCPQRQSSSALHPLLVLQAAMSFSISADLRLSIASVSQLPDAFLCFYVQCTQKLTHMHSIRSSNDIAHLVFIKNCQGSMQRSSQQCPESQNHYIQFRFITRLWWEWQLTTPDSVPYGIQEPPPHSSWTQVHRSQPRHFISFQNFRCHRSCELWFFPHYFKIELALDEDLSSARKKHWNASLHRHPEIRKQEEHFQSFFLQILYWNTNQKNIQTQFQGMGSNSHRMQLWEEIWS